MERTTVLIIGGGATGAGILRDLSMRGIDALLVEQQDLAYGTSSRYHGLLHSGGRYAVKDPEAARECIEENRILRKIGVHCVEAGEGFFIRTPEDDEAFEETWLRACGAAGIPAERISVGEALRKEPNLSPKIESVYRVPDAAVDGFRLIWQNVASARRYGGRIMTYTEVIGVAQSGGQVAGATVRNTLTGETKQISCDYIVSAAGSWAGKIAGLAGIAVKVRPDRGTLVAFNHRICGRVINRLRPPSDGDIFVPHGSITILGTTSASTENPDDTVPTAEEVVRLLEIGSASFEQIHQYRILRAFAGTRPLYSASGDAKGRGVSRGFVAIDHASDGLAHFISVVGGKFTTYRLMAEKVSDTVCTALGAGAVCRTAEESIVEDIDPETLTRVRKIFPVYGAAPAASRLGGAGLKRVLNRIEERPETGQLLCECETVTVAEAEVAAADVSSHTLSDVRRKTRMGMGTCQGAFCAYRCAGAMLEAKLDRELGGSRALLKEFIAGRWKGIRPVLWGNVLREAELTRSIYGVTLNIDGAMGYEKI